jgi:hypothetical protein
VTTRTFAEPPITHHRPANPVWSYLVLALLSCGQPVGADDGNGLAKPATRSNPGSDREQPDRNRVKYPVDLPAEAGTLPAQFHRGYEAVAADQEFLAEHYELSGEFATARACRKQVLGIFIVLYGAEDWRAIDARLALARIDRLAALDRPRLRRLREASLSCQQAETLADQGKNGEAIAAVTRALGVYKKLLGDGDALTLDSLCRIASLRVASEEFAEAETLYRQALKVRQKVLGLQHPDYLDTRDCLTRLYQAWLEKLFQGTDADVAVPVVERKLAFQRETADESLEAIASTLMTLARLHEYRSDFHSAYKAHEERLALLVKFRGGDHPQVADARFAMAHVRRLGELDAAQRQRLKEAEALLGNGRALAGDGKVKEALGLAERALVIYKEVLGDKDAFYADSLRAVADFCQLRGEYSKARSLYDRVLAIHRECLGEAHPNYAADLNRLAQLHEATADYAQAESLYRQGLAVRRRAQGEDRPDYDATLDHLAGVLEHRAAEQSTRGQFGAAADLDRELVAIRSRLKGERHWQTTDARLALADAVHRAALTANQLRELAEAEKQLAQAGASANADAKNQAVARAVHAVDCRKQILGEQQPEYAKDLFLLAKVYGKYGDYAAAEQPVRQAEAVLKIITGEDHPLYLAALFNLGAVYRETHRFGSAEATLLKALAVCKKVSGEQGGDCIACLNALGEVCYQSEDYSKAETYCRQALSLQEQSMQDRESEQLREVVKHLVARERAASGKYPQYIQSMSLLGQVYMEAGRYDAAKSFFQRVLEARKGSAGEDDVDYARALNNLAWFDTVTGDYAEAEPLYLRELEIFKRAGAEQSHGYAACLNNLARMHYQSGAYDKSIPLYTRALEIIGRVRGENSVDYSVCLDNLALVHVALKNYARAEPLYLQALKIKKNVLVLLCDMA